VEEELGERISDIKVVVSSMALTYPSCGGGEPGFFLLVELRRLELDWRGEAPGGLAKKLNELSSRMFHDVELSFSALSLDLIVMVTIGER
jgi:hypothetical protein